MTRVAGTKIKFPNPKTLEIFGCEDRGSAGGMYLPASLKEAAKVLLSSGCGIEGEANEIPALGCNGLIQKPLSINELSQKIRSIPEGTDNPSEPKNSRHTGSSCPALALRPAMPIHLPPCVHATGDTVACHPIGGFRLLPSNPRLSNPMTAAIRFESLAEHGWTPPGRPVQIAIESIAAPLWKTSDKFLPVAFVKKMNYNMLWPVLL